MSYLGWSHWSFVLGWVHLTPHSTGFGSSSGLSSDYIPRVLRSSAPAAEGKGREISGKSKSKQSTGTLLARHDAQVHTVREKSERTFPSKDFSQEQIIAMGVSRTDPNSIVMPSEQNHAQVLKTEDISTHKVTFFIKWTTDTKSEAKFRPQLTNSNWSQLLFVLRTFTFQ